MKTSWAATAGLIAMLVELVPLMPEAVKASVMLVATLCERFVKVTRPAMAV